MAIGSPNDEARLKRLHLLAGILAGFISAVLALGTLIWRASADRARIESQLTTLGERDERFSERMRRIEERQQRIIDGFGNMAGDVRQIKGLSEALLGMLRERRR